MSVSLRNFHIFYFLKKKKSISGLFWKFQEQTRWEMMSFTNAHEILFLLDLEPPDIKTKTIKPTI